MKDRDFAKLFQLGMNTHFSEKPPMDGIIKQYAVSSRQDGRMKWERENKEEKTAAEIIADYKQRKVK